MKYMVMEIHTAYAVVLDENGQFIKVANFNYSVGDMITDVVKLAEAETKPIKKRNTRRI